MCRCSYFCTFFKNIINERDKKMAKFKFPYYKGHIDYEIKDENTIEFKYLSKDMEEGYPGNLTLKAIYTLVDDTLSIRYLAECDQDTLINITNHSYFNLTGCKENIYNHVLELKADRFACIDNNGLPTGEIRNVENTPFDFNEPVLIGNRIEMDYDQIKAGSGIDHPFLFSCKENQAILPFIIASASALMTSAVLRKLIRGASQLKSINDIKKGEGLCVVCLSWIFAGAFATIPYLFFGLSPINAFFEATSGITATGATIFTHFDYPNALFFWRSFSQWLGGMGIIVLFIAVLPQFAIAGRQLFSAEAPGPTEEKITPRIKNTAASLWKIYFGMTILEIVL